MSGTVLRFANAGRPLRGGELMRPHVLHDVRPRQNIKWDFSKLENHLALNAILAARAKHVSHDSVFRTTPLRKSLWVQS